MEFKGFDDWIEIFKAGTHTDSAGRTWTFGTADLDRIVAGYDPAVHEAVQFGTSAEVSEPTVTTVFRSGYEFGGKLLRPAVVVVTGPEHAADAETPKAESPEAGASA